MPMSYKFKQKFDNYEVAGDADHLAQKLYIFFMLSSHVHDFFPCQCHKC